MLARPPLARVDRVEPQARARGRVKTDVTVEDVAEGKEPMSLVKSLVGVDTG